MSSQKRSLTLKSKRSSAQIRLVKFDISAPTQVNAELISQDIRNLLTELQKNSKELQALWLYSNIRLYNMDLRGLWHEFADKSILPILSDLPDSANTEHGFAVFSTSPDLKDLVAQIADVVFSFEVDQRKPA